MDIGCCGVFIEIDDVLIEVLDEEFFALRRHPGVHESRCMQPSSRRRGRM